MIPPTTILTSRLQPMVSTDHRRLFCLRRKSVAHCTTYNMLEKSIVMRLDLLDAEAQSVGNCAEGLADRQVEAGSEDRWWKMREVDARGGYT